MKKKAMIETILNRLMFMGLLGFGLCLVIVTLGTMAGITALQLLPAVLLGAFFAPMFFISLIEWLHLHSNKQSQEDTTCHNGQK